jgi:kinetochore protein Mis13/DSN1
LGTVYDNKDGDFEFTKRAKPSKKPATKASKAEQTADAAESTTTATSRTLKGKAQKPDSAPKEDAAPKTVQKKPRGKLPSSPAENAAPKTGRTKRTFQEIKSPSPKRPSRAQTNANHDRSPSPGFRPVTVKKKRQNPDQTPAPQPQTASEPARDHAAAPEDDKTTKIALPFADTPIIKRNKEMRKASADSNRRSSSGMRGRRASSLIDEGRGNGEFIFAFFSMRLHVFRDL